MDRLVIVFAVAIALAVALGSIAAGAPRRLPVKLAAVLIAIFLMPTAYAAFVELMGRPKPGHLEWFRANAGDARVVGSEIREGKAIYLWLQFKPDEEPVSYRLPWNERMARQLHETTSRHRKTGEETRFRWASRQRDDPGTEEMFYAPPPPALPPKYVGDAPAGVVPPR